MTKRKKPKPVCVCTGTGTGKSIIPNSKCPIHSGRRVVHNLGFPVKASPSDTTERED